MKKIPIIEKFKENIWRNLIVSIIIALLFFFIGVCTSLGNLTLIIISSILFIASILIQLMIDVVNELISMLDKLNVDYDDYIKKHKVDDNIIFYEHLKIKDLLLKSSKLTEIIRKNDPKFKQFEVFYIENIINRITDKKFGGGGYILYNIKNPEYLEILKKAIEKSTGSFYSTLTGEYDPAWFFRKDRNIRLKYLKEINENVTIKAIDSNRIMIFDRGKLIDSFKEILAMENGNNFLKDFFYKYHSKINLYWIEPNKLIEEMGAKYKEGIIKDFGMFDQYWIIMKNKNDCLEIIQSHHNDSYLNLFQTFYKLRNNNTFMNRDQIIKEFSDEIEEFKSLNN